ncbi:unnamed protein product [Rotaria magnacalcarata]|uniref:Uncharacterized protein n=1 Tax=Rotaria magnacalcarata TaxID=392030 RepID=A0A816LTB5_9BILA|nr:unnamed protein product [Rotaria magnacalcarata]
MSYIHYPDLDNYRYRIDFNAEPYGTGPFFEGTTLGFITDKTTLLGFELTYDAKQCTCKKTTKPSGIYHITCITDALQFVDNISIGVGFKGQLYRSNSTTTVGTNTIQATRNFVAQNFSNQKSNVSLCALIHEDIVNRETVTSTGQLVALSTSTTESEDCTSVISSISYDGTNDCFIGFSSELINGLPVTNQFKTDSYSELETWFEEFDKSTHVNAHLIEPLLTKTSSLVHSRPYIISAYGTNNKVNSIDIFRKWIHIYNECKNRKINVVGFSSDCDPRYPNHPKIDHNLVKSDVCLRDRQNYSSCLKITSDDVLNLLNRRNTKATFVYLYILKLIILTYVKKDTDILTRLYYGWIIVFSYRMWWSSLRIEQNLSQVEKDNQFITKAAWFSSEINIHCLTSIIILVSSGHLPVYALNTYLFSSQACEATFRSARSLNGTFSSITNFSVYEFMNKIEKISILNKIKSTEESSVTTCSIKFPIHHKNRRDESSTATNTQNLTPITITDMEKIIIKTYQKAEIIMNELQLTETLKKNGLDDCKKLSSFVFKELNERSIVDYSFVDDDDIEESSDDEADDNNDNTS